MWQEEVEDSPRDQLDTPEPYEVMECDRCGHCDDIDPEDSWFDEDDDS